jgi:hypothetical protein
LVAVPGGASGLLCRDYKGKEADQLITRIDPGVVSLVAELRGHERQADLRGTGPVESSRRGAQAPRRGAGGDYAGDADDAAGRGNGQCPRRQAVEELQQWKTHVEE